MNPEIVERVMQQLRSFGQEIDAMTIITVLDALHNSGHVVHQSLTVKCADAWSQET